MVDQRNRKYRIIKIGMGTPRSHNRPYFMSSSNTGVAVPRKHSETIIKAFEDRVLDEVD